MVEVSTPTVGKDTDVEGWQIAHPDDSWVYDKLIVSKKLKYVCGPSGMDVPKPDVYCVRPITNMHGMGLSAKFEHLDKNTDHLHPGEFWCETFYGKHISVDYLDTKPVLTVIGERDTMSPIYKWDKWTKIDHCIDYPAILKNLKGSYPKVNCEFIDGHLIEIHFRHNPDFVYGNTVAIPVWDEKDAYDTDNYVFVKNPDYKRLGFLIDKQHKY